MGEHAEGPWEAWGPTAGIYHIQATNDDGDRFTLCDGIASGEHAHLLAAAPDMLDALRMFKSHADYIRNLWGKEGVTERVVQAVEAAIAKATGTTRRLPGAPVADDTTHPPRPAPGPGAAGNRGGGRTLT